MHFISTAINISPLSNKKTRIMNKVCLAHTVRTVPRMCILLDTTVRRCTVSGASLFTGVCACVRAGESI